MNQSPIEHALSHLLSGAPDAALRWSAAALEAAPASPAALVVTARALWRIGRRRAAVDGFAAAARRAATAGDTPMAIAAIAELRALGVEYEKLLGEIAAVVCRDAAAESPWAEAPAWRGNLQPLGPLLTRRALASRATQLIYESAHAEQPDAAPPFPGAISRAAFAELASAFQSLIVPAGYRAIEEDDETQDLFVVASGEVEVSRRGSRFDARSLATLESGAMFGEMSMLAKLPSASSAVTTRPTILLAAARTRLEEIGARHKDLRLELDAHCRRQAVGNLGSACSFITAVPVRDRGALVDRMVCRVHARGEKLVRKGEEAAGVHLILAGDVALVGHDGSERVILSTLTAGDVVGEAELVLCRRAETEAIAAGPAATLFLPRDEFFALALDYPAILHGLYAAAVRRLGETGDALESGTAAVADADVEVDEPAHLSIPSERPRPDARIDEADPAPEPRVEPPRVEPPRVEPPRPELAAARVASLPPPIGASSWLAMPGPASSAEPAPSSANVVVPAAPSLAPVAASSPPPPPASRPAPSPRTSFARRTAQGAAVVAVAASVAAVLATSEERPSALTLPQSGSRAQEETPPAPVLASPPVATAAAPVPVAHPEPSADVKSLPSSAPSSAAPRASSAPPPEVTKAFLTSSLRKRSVPPPVQSAAPPAADIDPAPSGSATAERPLPAARATSNPPPAGVVSAPPAARPVPSDDNAFGGRE